jgi:hypothetical protein
VFLHLGIAPKALDSAVDSFITSAQYANVIDSNNRLLLSGTEKITLPTQPTESDSTGLKPKSDFQQVSEEPKESQKNDIDFHKFEFITSTGKKAFVQIPIGCKKDDLEKLKKILDAMCGD